MTEGIHGSGAQGANVHDASGHGDARFGLLRFQGPDARKFLQGQLSNDMNELRADRLLLAGLHNPQGRVLALLQLAAPAADEVIALLSAELAEATAATLRRYVLRAKLSIAAEQSAATLAALAAQVPAVAAYLATQSLAQDIAAGVPQVYGATSGAFVAQMLNLDCIGAVSFSKGCYTGQEIIARAHYRGRMKRRMQRFESNGPAALAPGEAVTLGDGRGAQIVTATVRADGRTEFLAVTSLEGPTETGTSTARLAVAQLALPYALPD
ncbi:MAG: folate-binding protein YgfZ [Gammaproteobacteria bacterium]|nr:folate-binding protein YgfZ [Gammaproteobacteria bacterium]